MSSTGRKSKNISNTQFNESNLPRSERPTIIERGKKFAAYDKNGKLIILGYNKKIVKEYANDRVRKTGQG